MAEPEVMPTAPQTTPETDVLPTEGSLLDQVMQETHFRASDEGYDQTRHGVQALLSNLLQPGTSHQRIDRELIDKMIAEVDMQLSQQLDEILHHPTFQELESAWRGLYMVVDRTDFRENIKLELLNVSKDALKEDFNESGSDVTTSGLYKQIYTANYGQFGGEPVGAMIANYEFNRTAPDTTLLQAVAKVGAMAHTPFMAAAGAQFFDMQDFRDLPKLNDLKAKFEEPQYIKWQSFRESEDARYVGLTMPRFLLRLPYDPMNNPVRAFTYREEVGKSHQHYLWGNAAFAFATRLTESFAGYRWCTNIIGPKSGGTVENLPLHQFEAMGALETKIPTEVLISDRREYELAEEGFIPLVMRVGSDNACFFWANSAQKAKNFGNSPEGKEAETNYKLGTQLPYIFMVSRLAHYLKVIQREQLGSFKERVDLELQLRNWIRQYVADQDNPSVGVRERRPLRQALIEVEDVEGDPGWYRVNIKVRPHFKYAGANITLSLVGKLDV